MNIPLLRRIQRQIDKAPERFKMSGWFEAVSCGTACCVAGWACVLSGKAAEDKDYDVLETAEELLELEPDTWEQLFFVECWPKQFWPEGYDPEDDLKNNPDKFDGLPALAIKRIDHFISTNGAE